MKSLPSVLTDALSSQEYIQTILVSMDIGGFDFRFTSWNQPILYTGNLYEPRGMKFHGVSYSSASIVDAVDMDFDDTDRHLYAVFGDLSFGNYPITLIMAILNDIGKVVSHMVLFSGTLDKWNYTPGVIKLTAVSIFAQWARETTARFSASCRWKVFKGVECQAVSDETICDRTYDQCKNLHQNEVNFGGFRWLPSMINKRIEIK